MNPIRLHVSLVHSGEWIFSSWGPNMGTLCFSAVLIWRSGSNDSSPSPHQHRPTVFDASNQPTGGLATNHPWIHSHPAWRRITAMADATYRAPSALHFISFLTLPSPGKKKKKKHLFHSLSKLNAASTQFIHGKITSRCVVAAELALWNGGRAPNFTRRVWKRPLFLVFREHLRVVNLKCEVDLTI